ncbi:hypothetical protein [Pseudomonas nunensis]|jgi:hypothetical protein|uniref:hypothetical protein n=1 Tax=Pseudomonas nunensis TaxID=2961896 RepID=UPI0025B1BE43|nr:hypothetical protein [Pseudomonas nunensis]MDN3219860.1 hypothetical protein [Pseudomonas nunensis]
MSATINNSFVATLEIPDQHLNLLEILHGGPAISTELLGSGGFYSGRPQPRDDSSLLGFRPKEEVHAIAPLQLFFLGGQGGYSVFTLNSEGRLDLCIRKNRVNILETVPYDTEERTLFNLINERGNLITLDDLLGDNHWVSIKSEDDKYIGGLTLRGSAYRYLSEVRDNYKMTFNLKILERL